MADEHTRRMFQWRKQVSADRKLTPFDFCVAYAVAEKTYRDSGCAVVSHARIAAAVGATTRGVQKSLHRIAARGHMHIEDNSKRGRKNRYWPILRSGEGAAGPGQGTNVSSTPPDSTPELPFVPSEEVRTTVRTPYEPPFVPPTNRRSYPLRTTVHTRVAPLTSPEGTSDTSSDESGTKRPGIEQAFAEFYGLYPRREDPRAALGAYKEAIARGATVEQIKHAAMRYAAERTGKDSTYTKKPANWLKADGWKNEPPEQPSSSVTEYGRNDMVAAVLRTAKATQ